MLECPVCQQLNRPEARFCRHCGATLTSPDTLTPLTSTETPQPKPDIPAEPEQQLEVQSPKDIAVEALPETEEALPPKETLPDGIEETSTPDETASHPEIEVDQPTGASERLAGAETVHGTTLSVGDLIGERYRLTQLISGTEESMVFAAEDLRLCPSCAHLQSEIGDTYCENCGALLEPHPTVTIYSAAHVPAASENAVISLLSDGEEVYQVVTQAAHAPPHTPPIWHLVVGVQSDSGQVREIDEDSVLALQAQALSENDGSLTLGFFAVADGIGGHDVGEIASSLAIRTLAQDILSGIFVPVLAGNPATAAERQVIFKQAMIDANQAILNAHTERGQDMGSTLTAALVYGEQATILNVGDSRTYLMRMGQLKKITDDHSMVAKLLAQGMIQPDEVNTHDQKSVIYRSLGGEVDLELADALYEITLEPGDRLLLCCDGLWEMVSDPYIEDTLLEYLDPQAAADRLVELANLAGGEDNISAVVINVQSLKRFRQ